MAEPAIELILRQINPKDIVNKLSLGDIEFAPLKQFLRKHATCLPSRTLEFFGGCSEILIPDNLKSAATKPCRYEPDINPTYQEMANYYDVAIVPARVVRKPKDKSVVENGVQRIFLYLIVILS